MLTACYNIADFFNIVVIVFFYLAMCELLFVHDNLGEFPVAVRHLRGMRVGSQVSSITYQSAFSGTLITHREYGPGQSY